MAHVLMRLTCRRSSAQWRKVLNTNDTTVTPASITENPTTKYS
jgi:hypothetical protein